MGTATPLDFTAAKLSKLPEELSAEVLRSCATMSKTSTAFCPSKR
jgi:flagellar motor switch protein FliG